MSGWGGLKWMPVRLDQPLLEQGLIDFPDDDSMCPTVTTIALLLHNIVPKILYHPFKRRHAYADSRSVNFVDVQLKVTIPWPAKLVGRPPLWPSSDFSPHPGLVRSRSCSISPSK